MAPAHRVGLLHDPQKKEEIIVGGRARLFLATLLGLLLLLLLGLHGGPVDVPCKSDLQDDEDEDHEQNGEQVRLIIEGVHGLLCCADLEEPVELTRSHCVESCRCLVGFEVIGVCK